MPRNDSEFRANQAQQLLDNELFQAAFDSVEQGIIRGLKGTVMDGSDDSIHKILEQVRSLQNIGAVKKSIQSRITNHKLTVVRE